MIRTPDASQSTPTTGSSPPRTVTFVFADTIEMAEVAGTLMLAEFAAESVHGAGRVLLDIRCELDREARLVRIDTSTRAGKGLALIFLGFARREFGERAVTVKRGGEGVRS